MTNATIECIETSQRRLDRKVIFATVRAACHLDIKPSSVR